MSNASNLSLMVLWALRQKLRRLILNQQKLQPIFLTGGGGGVDLNLYPGRFSPNISSPPKLSLLTFCTLKSLYQGGLMEYSYPMVPPLVGSILPIRGQILEVRSVLLIN